jgi:ABC-2 type transport system permease protein
MPDATVQFALQRSPLDGIGAMVARSLRLTRRNPDALLTSLLLPVMLMLVFVYLFGGAIQTGSGAPKYVQYVVPGVLLLCAGFGSAMTAVSVCQDMSGGIIDRFRSMDVGAATFLSGHVAASALRNGLSAVLVVGVGVAAGFRSHTSPLAWLAAAGILLAFICAISWLSAAVGTLTKSVEAANGFTYVSMFATYASSAFVPIHTMPRWLRGFAEYQPCTPIIEALRALLVGGPVGPHAWQALAWCGGILMVSIALSRLTFRRRTA